MGVVAVRRDAVNEWLLPVPDVTVGQADIVVDVSPASVRVAGLASVSVPIVGLSPVLVSGVVAVAEVDGYGDAEQFPAVSGSAAVVFDNEGYALAGNLSAALAELIPNAAGVLAVEGECLAGLLFATTLPFAAVTEGGAEVSFGYFGDGDDPIFPFKLPFLFTDNPLNIQDAAAVVVVSGSGVLDAVAGFGDASLLFDGDVGLTRKGTTPVFPFPFPIVFDDLPANVQVGSALLVVDGDGECGVAVFGESAVPVEGGGTHLASAVLPWVFPVALVGAA